MQFLYHADIGSSFPVVCKLISWSKLVVLLPHFSFLTFIFLWSVKHISSVSISYPANIVIFSWFWVPQVRTHSALPLSGCDGWWCGQVISKHWLKSTSMKWVTPGSTSDNILLHFNIAVNYTNTLTTRFRDISPTCNPQIKTATGKPLS